MLKILLQRVLISSVALWCAWLLLSISFANHYVEQALAGNEDAVGTALWWDASHPRALTLRGSQLLGGGDLEAARDHLQRAIQANPADARPLVLLAALEAEAGREGLADQMIEVADRLMPVEPAMQRRIGFYWFAREQPDLALNHLSKALHGNREYRAEFFPLFLRIAQDESLRQLLMPLVAEPPAWWDGWGGFFDYLTREAEDVATVRALVDMRESTAIVPLSGLERRFYANRLRKEGLVSAAYLVWINGLDSADMQSLGYLYNGSFEREFADAGFGWHARSPKNSGIRITTGATYGIGGEKALHLSFRGDRVRFQHLWQNLFLAPGHYELSGQVRPDKLTARRGLQWRVYCSAGATGLLGQSDEFAGTGDWREFRFTIEAPPECVGQTLRLYSAGNRDVDHELKGGIWFDDMRIELKR